MARRYIALLVLFAFPALAQRGANRAAQQGTPVVEEKPEEGIPVTDALVISKCGACHKKDEKGNLSRISWERATPEAWEEAIKRMVRLNGLTMTPVEARSILKYLSTYHGLAPEEAKQVMYMAEHRIQDEPISNEIVRGTCTSCHELGRALQWKRSKEDWKLLANMHVFFFPQADQAFRRGGYGGGGFGGGGGGGGGAAANGPTGPTGPMPVDQSIDYLVSAGALHSSEWGAWRARMRSPKIAGRWLVSAYIAGRGKYFGEMVIEPSAGEDEFTTRVKLQSVKDGSTLVRSGKGLVYAGYSWRGRSNGSAAAGTSPDDLSKEMREALWISPDQTHAEGRWFWGAYQEFGIDVKLERASEEATLGGVDRFSLKTGSQAQRVRLFGSNLPANVTPDLLDFGSGVKVRRIVAHTANELTVEVDVATDAVPGKRDIALRRSVLQSAIAVYDRIDYIKVTPESSIARLGSEAHPKGYRQYEAIGYQRGADGQAHTADDVELGPVDVSWSVEEFYSVYGDDDKDFVGTLGPAGFFTPASDGPNPKRKFSRNNYGDVWVVATAKSEKDADGKPLVGKSYLVVTVPMYVRWDQPEVAQ